MGKSVLHVDTSCWDAAAQARLACLEADKAGHAAYRDALAAHPFAGALESLSDEALEASRTPYWVLRHRDFGNGHQEAVMIKVYPDPQAVLDRAIQRDLRALAPRGDGDREPNIERAARRARRDVQGKCKALGVNALWTLTYRENVQDRAVALRHLDAFRRRVVSLLGEWRYIAVLERQERGAWHIHLATHELPARITKDGVKFKSWDVMRSVWRACVGSLGGNFDESRRKGRWGSNRKIKGGGAIGAYIAGYVAKDMEQTELNQKRYSASQGIDLPRWVRERFELDVRLDDLIVLCYAAVGESITRRWYDAARGIVVVESDDSGSFVT